jgi:hypothetical protein
VPSPIRLRNLDDAQLQRLVTKITGATTLPDRTAVLNRFADQLHAEAWQERAQGFIRSQGLATDGDALGTRSRRVGARFEGRAAPARTTDCRTSGNAQES